LFKSISISSHHKDILLQHAHKSIPNESCALLFGNIKKGKVEVTDTFLTKNAEESPVNFTIDNQELIDGYKRAEERNLQVVGIFHSHPTSEAYPSKTDQEFMLANPVVWLISGKQKELRAFVLDMQVKEIPVSISQ